MSTSDAVATWARRLSPERWGRSGFRRGADASRNEFQIDYDRLIFSSPFRRLQNKTQVFPLPGSVFVHNRLTHSLEVASLGRSLGSMVAGDLCERYGNGAINGWPPAFVGDCVAAACLAHDIGNPPFGHAGEAAIGAYFRSESVAAWLRSQGIGDELLREAANFEGNANSFRILTHSFPGRRRGGDFALTYPTLAATVKYPWTAEHADGRKYGFFQSEAAHFQAIAHQLGMEPLASAPLRYGRHPLVYLVEAADDICYNIIDLEDAHRLGILSTADAIELMSGFFNAGERQLNSVWRNAKEIEDDGEQIAYWRARTIGVLLGHCAAAYRHRLEEFLGSDGAKRPLFEDLPPAVAAAQRELEDFSVEAIYNHRPVVEIELAGNKVLGGLLEEFVPAVLAPQDGTAPKLLRLLPRQFQPPDQAAPDERLRAVLDFVAGMTDLYALDLYRKIKGLSLPELS